MIMFAYFKYLVGVVLLLLPSPSAGMQGDFATFNFLTNKKLPFMLYSVSAKTKPECQKKCSLNPQCQAFAMSTFEQTCTLYGLAKGNAPVVNNGYQLYVLKKSPEDGYFVYGQNYIKLFTILMNAENANKRCKDEGGMLIAIQDDGLNNLVNVIMTDQQVYSAFIGVTDQAQEGNWLYYDQTPAGYTNWNYNGMWYRRDKNCAIVRIDKNWYQRNCGDVEYFFCQIPIV